MGSQALAGGIRHLPNDGPEVPQSGAFGGKGLERFGGGEQFVGIAGDTRPTEVADAIHDFHGAGSGVGEIATVED